MSAKETLDISQEPKKVIANFLIAQLNEARFFIFTRPELESTGLNTLDGIISSLGPDHQNKLSELHKAIRAASMRGGIQIDARDAYQKVSRYLHTSPYFVDVGIGIIPMATIKPDEGDRKAPEAKITARVNSKL